MASKAAEGPAKPAAEAPARVPPASEAASDVSDAAPEPEIPRVEAAGPAAGVVEVEAASEAPVGAEQPSEASGVASAPAAGVSVSFLAGFLRVFVRFLSIFSTFCTSNKF